MSKLLSITLVPAMTQEVQARDSLDYHQLLPEFKELERRFNERGPVLTKAELLDVYQGQVELKGYDKRIDNTHLTSAMIVKQIAAFL
jgi:hypothetical protein